MNRVKRLSCVFGCFTHSLRASRADRLFARSDRSGNNKEDEKRHNEALRYQEWQPQLHRRCVGRNAGITRSVIL